MWGWVRVRGLEGWGVRGLGLEFKSQPHTDVSRKWTTAVFLVPSHSWTSGKSIDGHPLILGIKTYIFYTVVQVMPRPSSDSTRDSPNRSNQTWITMKSREKNGEWNEQSKLIRPINYSLLIMETTRTLGCHQSHLVPPEWQPGSSYLCLFKSIQMVLYYLSICLSIVNDSLIHCDRFPFLLTRWWIDNESFLINCASCWNKCPSGLFAWILSQNTEAISGI